MVWPNFLLLRREREERGGGASIFFYLPYVASAGEGVSGYSLYTSSLVQHYGTIPLSRIVLIKTLFLFRGPFYKSMIGTYRTLHLLRAFLVNIFIAFNLFLS